MFSTLWNLHWANHEWAKTQLDCLQSLFLLSGLNRFGLLLVLSCQVEILDDCGGSFSKSFFYQTWSLPYLVHSRTNSKLILWTLDWCGSGWRRCVNSKVVDVIADVENGVAETLNTSWQPGNNWAAAFSELCDRLKLVPACSLGCGSSLGSDLGIST